MVSLQAIGSVIRSWPRLDLVYSFLWSLLALFIPLIIHPSISLPLTSISTTVSQSSPLIILTVCNVCLMRALQQSRRLQSECRASCSRTQSTNTVTSTGARTATGSGNSGTGSGNNGQQRITPTLVALIVVFTVCVGPSGLLDFFREHVLQTGADGSRDMFYAYQTATVVTNCLFLVNFAVNFILYCG